MVNDGRGITGVSGAIPFPKDGTEAIWNAIDPHRGWTESAVTDIADVYAQGAIAWGKQPFMTLDPGKSPGQRGSYQDLVGAYFMAHYPVPPAGLRTVDEDYGYNDSPERYEWKLTASATCWCRTTTFA